MDARAFPAADWETGPLPAGPDPGILARQIDALFADPEAFGRTLALVVVHRGRIVAERYDPDHAAFAASKQAVHGPGGSYCCSSGTTNIVTGVHVLGCGAHWWLIPSLPGSMTALGYQGQFTIVDPCRDLVIVRLGVTDAALNPALRDALVTIAREFPAEKRSTDKSGGDV